MPVPPRILPAPSTVGRVERLTADRAATLETVTKANGYPFDLRVERTTRGSNAPDDLSCYLTAGGPQRIDLDEFGVESGDPINRTVVPHVVEVFRRVSERDDTPLDRLLAEASAWVQLAWTADCTCGGVAEGTWWVADTYYPFNDPPGVRIEFNSLLWTDARSPLLPRPGERLAVPR